MVEMTVRFEAVIHLPDTEATLDPYADKLCGDIERAIERVSDRVIRACTIGGTWHRTS